MDVRLPLEELGPISQSCSKRSDDSVGWDRKAAWDWPLRRQVDGLKELKFSIMEALPPSPFSLVVARQVCGHVGIDRCMNAISLL